jgi:predicted MFS family arabinose efflux permease
VDAALGRSVAVTQSDLFAPVRDRRALAVLVVTLFAVSGHFAAYTYLAPLLQDHFGLAPADVTTMLLLYGVAGLDATLAAPQLIAHSVRFTLLGVFVTAAVVLLLARYSGGTPLATFCALAWGLAFGLMPGSLSAWMQQSQPHATDAGQAWFVGFFQSAIALGVWGGGGAFSPITLVSTASAILVTIRLPRPVTMPYATSTCRRTTIMIPVEFMPALLSLKSPCCFLPMPISKWRPLSARWSAAPA